jgi:maleate isomerase
MPTQPLRVGLIVPSSNTVMEPDFHRRIGASAIVSTTRIFLEDVTREAETRMLEEDLPLAIKLIGTTDSQVIVFGCTSAGALGKLSHNDAISRLIEEQTGAKALTALRAVLMLLSSIRAQKIVVLTPYIDDLTGSIARSLAEAGFSIIKAAGMGIKANLEIGRVMPAEILRFAESQLSGIDPDCLFLSCTNWRAIETIQHLQKKLSIPVITSNQAAIEIVKQQAKGRLAKEARP